jgi:ubiquinone/menaquinone biosynthesis C-methylase UbiE
MTQICHDRESIHFERNSYRKSGRLSPHQARRLRLIKRLLAPCSGRLLDYGCGFGDIAWSLADRFEVTGVDVIPERVEWASREYDPVRFETCGPAGLRFADEEFDTVLSSVVIHWVQDPDAYLAEISRVLTAEGQLVILFQNQPVLNNLVRRWTGRLPTDQGFWNEGYAEMVNRVRRHGFVVEQIDCFYESPRDVVKSLRSGIIEAIQLPFRAVGLPNLAHYYGIRARKLLDSQLRPVGHDGSESGRQFQHAG